MIQYLESNMYKDFPGYEVDYPKKIEIFADSLQGLDFKKDTFKIIYLNEVVGIEQLKDFIIQNHKQFDAIITHHPDVLESCENSYLLVRGTAWVFDYNFPEKSYSVSNLAGEKTQTKGHLLRQKIHYKQNKIKINKNFFVGKFGGVEKFEGNSVLTGKKDPMYDSQFNIAIENVKQDNWFTEKIIDCFQTKTVPVYWGCPNIGDWFNEKGIIVVDNVNDIIDACNSINESTYQEMIPYIEENYEKSHEFVRVNERMFDLIKEILANNAQG